MLISLQKMTVYAFAMAVFILPSATIAAPVPVLDFSENINQWSLAAGWFYLTDNCYDNSAETNAYIKRRQVFGNFISTLEDINSKPQCRTFRHAATDESGIYYYNRNLGRLEAIYSDRPNDPPTALATIGDWIDEDLSKLQLYGSSVYWIEETYNGEFNPSDISIKRISKSGGTVKTMITYSTASSTSYNGLGISNRYIWWTDSQGLNRINSCGQVQCLPGNPTKDVFFPINGSKGNIHMSGSTVYWWNGSDNPETIRRTSCTFFTGNCTTSTLHTTASGTTIIGLSADSVAAYWVEDLFPLGLRLRRKAISGGIAETLVEEGVHRAAPYVDSTGIYIQTDSDTISIVSLNAQAITREFGINAWEVTQGLQRSTNDVPLVAGKTTYVRLYPSLLDGEDAGSVIAQLHGSRDGQALPGSPIYPLNVAIPVSSSNSLASRADEDGGWLFRLPESWTRTGSDLIPQTDTTINLRAVVDPLGAYADSDNADNNEIEGDFLFTAKAPTCLTMRPVSTAGPYQPLYNQNVGQEMILAESVLPTANLIGLPKNDPLREVKWCWKAVVYGPFCSTPYELNNDTSVMLAKMLWLDFWADHPAICGQNNARTLYAGIVHEKAPWGSNGIALTGYDVQVSKIPKYGQRIDWKNQTGMTLPHEIGHNYDRKHIDCNDPDDPDAGYQYPTDRVDYEYAEGHSELHFGFEPLLQTPINTATTGKDSIKDFMSYCDPSWYSDYTWKAIFNNTRDPIFVPPQLAKSVAGSMVRIAGIVGAGNASGTLNYAWTLPTSQASASQFQKLVTRRADTKMNSITGDNVHLQLRGTGDQLLLDQPIQLMGAEDADPNGPKTFELVLDAPVATVARVELMVGNSILASLLPGTAKPAISINQPAGGASAEDQITIAWTATDADGDDLLYTILYSPDGGNKWFPLLVNYGGTGAVNETLTLNLLSEAGSDGPNALVRVLVSDGYNTSIATSQAFSVAKRGPSVAIVHPAQGQVFAANELIPLLGYATDPEDGLIGESQFVWSTGRTGKSTEIRGLAPGAHDIELAVTDADGLESITGLSFEVAPLAVPKITTAFNLDGRCDDAGYLQATQLPLTAYSDGTRASARIFHSSSYFWLCLSGLKDVGGYTGLLLDADNSQESTVQVGDLGFFVRQDGTAFMNEGNAGSFAQVPVDNRLSARIFAHASGWSAELRVRSSAFGGFEKRLSLAIGHFEQAGSGVTRWPLGATETSPISWAQTNLGLIGALTALTPDTSILGSGDIALSIDGANFTANHHVLWNGTIVATTLVNANTLDAVVPDSLVTTAGAYAVSVGLTGQAGLETASLPFTVQNPIPVIASLTPSHVVMGDSGVLLTINGTNFIAGATVIWNGEPRATTFVSATRLQFILVNADLVSATTIPVVVWNPQPNAKPSNTAMFVISVAEGVIFFNGFEN